MAHTHIYIYYISPTHYNSTIVDVPFPVWPVVGPLEGVTSSRSCQEKKKLEVSLLEYPQRSFWKSQSPGSGPVGTAFEVVGLTGVGFSVVGLAVEGFAVVGLAVVCFPGLII